MEKNQVEAVKLCENGIRWALILAVSAIPAILSPISFDAYGLPKAILLHALALIAVSSFMVRSLLAGEIAIKKNPINKPLLAFTTMATIAAACSPVPLVSLIGEYARYENLPTIYSYVALCFLAGQLTADKKWLSRLVLALSVSFGVISMYGILQALGSMPIDTSISAMRSKSTLGDPVLFGGYLAVMIPLLFGYLISKEEVPALPRTAIALLLITGFSGAILSQSLGAWLGIAAGMLVAVALNRNHLFKGLGAAFAVGVLGVTFTLLIVTIARSGTLTETALSLNNGAVAAIDLSSGTGANRIEAWKSSVEMISVRPLEGYGPDQMYLWSGAFTTLRKAQIEKNTIPDRAHNIFLQTAVNGGVVYLMAFLWLIITLIVATIAFLRSAGGMQCHVSGMLAALAGYIAQGLFSADAIGVAAPAWVLAGIVSAVLPVRSIKMIAIPLRIRGRIGATAATAMLALSLIILSATPLIADMHFLKGLTHTASGRTDQAISELTAAVETYPYQAKYSRELAISLLKQGNRLRDAHLIEQGKSAIEDGLRYNPHDFDLIMTLAGAYRVSAAVTSDQSEIGRAEYYYGKAIHKNPYSTNPRRGLLGLYMMQEKHADVIEQAKMVLQIDPGDIEVKHRLAQAYEKTGKIGRAKKLYKEILSLAPGRADARAALENIE